MIFGVALARAGARAAAGARARRAAGADPGPHRPPGARERDPPAAAHRGHRLGADDRPRARRVRDDLRRRPARVDRQGRSTSRCRPRGIVQHQDGFSPLPDRRGRAARARSPGSTTVSPMRFETGKLRESDGNQAGHRRRPGDGRQGAQARTGTTAPCRRSGGAQGRPGAGRQELRQGPQAQASATSCTSPRATGTQVDLPDRRHVRQQGRPDRRRRSSPTPRWSASGSPRTSRSRCSPARRAPTPKQLAEERPTPR